MLFVVENNGYGLSTPTPEAVPVEDIAAAAAGYGMPGYVVDGNDLEAVIATVQKAARRARDGGGPALLEMKTFRMRGHEEASGTKYVPEGLFDLWRDRDPLERYRQSLLDAGMPAAELEAIDVGLAAEIEEVAEWALTQPESVSTPEAESGAVFAPATPRAVASGEAEETRFIDALSDGLRDAMDADETVILMGQDVAEYGGVFKVTEGFLERFGRERVRNTPIIENGAIGCAMGLALDGFTPVVEMQYADFISCGFNQIVNNLATTRYRWGSALNVTIRAPFGGGIGAGPFHSQSPEAWFCHVPGLKVVVPGHAAGREGPLARGHRGPQPRPVLRAQEAVPLAQGARRLWRGRGAARRGGRRAGGRGPDGRDVGRGAPVGAGGGGAPEAGVGRERRGRRPADADPVGPRDGARERAQDGAPRRAA